eukprot:TRINITY_DN3219_c0_g1_i2.p1 TRINITY_DN3219_c0_g1~~TRINITY_DN3219_c0_g1_i2.p1  ORF type:complete len:121 (-),score=23.30 TRINITY_DN3219_c0_g1_i2:73-435(-)
MAIVLLRHQRDSSFVQWRDYTLVYKRYAGLYFIMGIDNKDNELITLEVIHRFVTILDKIFPNVCELDLIFGFKKVFYALDEFLIAGEIQESSANEVIKSMQGAVVKMKADALETAFDGII